MVLSLAAVMALGCGQALHRSDGRARSAADENQLGNVYGVPD